MTRSIKGTEIEVGMMMYTGFYTAAKVVAVSKGQLVAGARFADVVLENGESPRCWEGFLYRIVA
jgi:hypothetical protein